MFINIYLEKINNPTSRKEQREKLLEINNDLLFWVYSLKDETNKEIKLDYLENILTCYQNQFNNLKWIKNNPDITIVNLESLMKWKIEILSWKKEKIFNPVLLSGWVIEIIEAINNKWITKKHLISTLRDSWAIYKLQRTTIAWRNSWDNLFEDLEREQIEESPFLWKNKDWNLTLATIDNSYKSKEILSKSINYFLENKYVDTNHKNYTYICKTFERNFPGIKYNELGRLLREIIDDDRFTTYSSNSIDNFKWLEKDIKEISLENSRWKYFVYFDKDNNTIEYRLISTITWFKDWFELLSKRPSRLYLESENQYPRIPRIDKAQKWYLPVIKYFSEKVENLMKYWSISSIVLTEEAEKLWLDVEIVSKDKNLFYISSEKKEVLFKSTDFWINTSLWVKMSNNKEFSYDIFKRNWLPIANTWYIEKNEIWNLDLHNYVFPVIIKPIEEDHWNWIMMNITSIEELKEKLEISFNTYEKMIVQKQIKGEEYRLLVLMWKVIVAMNLIPASITWDWIKNIWDLIKLENKNNILRWNWYKKALSFIQIDKELINYIWKQFMDLDTIPIMWKKIILRWNSNIWTWWTMIDVSDIISDDIKEIACKSAKLLWLGIAWVDIITTDITKPLKETWWIILEINETPWLWWDRELTNTNTWKVILEKVFF